MSVSGRSNASTLQIATHSDYQIETFGLPYPVQLSEALTFGKSTALSVNCSGNGWAWAVFGRKLYIWQYREPKTSTAETVLTPQRRTFAGQCRILTLPHSDIGHKASLVIVFVSEGLQMASCLACSPTGDVRFWPSIANDGSSVDENGILEGQEFDQLINLHPYGYLLSTTTCHLVLLQLQYSGSRQGITHRVIKPPSGLFGGFGRKLFASIVGLNSNEKENKMIKVCSEKSRSEYQLSVLADRWLQEWTFNEDGETFKHEDTEILKKVREFYQAKIWLARDVTDVKYWLLDMQTNKGTLLILTAAVNLQQTNVRQFEFALLSFARDGDVIQFVAGVNLRHKDIYNEDDESNLQLNFILNRGIAYIYDEKNIFPVSLTGADMEEADKIEFKSQGDKILSAAAVNGFALFFSKNHGVISITPSDFDHLDINNSSVSPEVLSIGMPLTESSFSMQTTNYTTMHSLSMYEYDPAEITSTSNDIVNQIKAAFMYHLKRNATACSEIVNDLIEQFYAEEQTNGKLDRAVVAISKDIAEDMPAADPRWQKIQGEETHPLGSSTSMQIIQQLKDKNIAFTHFVSFLQTVGLWEKLYAVTEFGTVRSTHQVVVDIHEKILAAIALKNIHGRGCPTVDEAIEVVLEEKKVRSIENLTSQDLFYVKVTHVTDIIHAFTKVLYQQTNQESAPLRIQTMLIEINSVLLAMFNEINNLRLKNAVFLNPKFEYIPWTNMTGKNGAYDPIFQLINENLQQSLKSINAPDIRQKYFQQIAEMVDFVLEGKQKYLQSVQEGEKRKLQSQKFEKLRSELITPFVDNNQFDLASRLAEKYLDFQTLVLIADRTNNPAKLAEYNEKFKQYNFFQFALNWHLRQNKQSTIFERFKHDKNSLTEFLNDHPTLAWIQTIMNGEHNKAAQILFALAQNERELVERKRVMLSLAKLAVLASEDSELSVDLAEINAELVLIQHQDHLSKDLLLAFAYDVNNQKVLTSEEIIHVSVAPFFLPGPYLKI